jgi:hypothetical protein
VSYMRTDRPNQHLEKMISTRITEANIDSIDKLARGLGISRSDWIRQAILAELVMELAELKREEPEKPQVTDNVIELGAKNPFLEDLVPEYEEEELVIPPETLAEMDAIGIKGMTPVPEHRNHDINCVKSFDHEGECLP